MDIDTRKIVEAVLALLCLTLHDGAWDEKLLHLEPGRHSQIVMLTDKGLQESERLFSKLFVKRALDRAS